MNRKVLKIVTILLLAVMAVTMLSTSVFALTADEVQVGDFTNVGDTSDATKSIGRFMGSIVTAIQVVGMAVAVIMLVVLAIKYIAAAPSEKAEIKKSATVYVVGAIVLFAAAGILQVVKNFTQNVDSATSGNALSYIRMIDEA